MSERTTEKAYIATCACMSCVHRLGPAHCETVEQICCGSRYPIHRVVVPPGSTTDSEATR